jgi:hypothetical protein
MEKEPSAMLVAELQYQADLQVRVVDVIRLVAKWCVVLGAIPLTQLALELVNVASIRMWPSLSRHVDRLSVAVELLWVGSGAWLTVLGFLVIRGNSRHLRWLWIALSACVVCEFARYLLQVYFYLTLNIGGVGVGRITVFGGLFLKAMTSLAPPAILWTILRQRVTREAIDELN